MDDNGGPQEGAIGGRQDELPQIDGSCDACEPDEAQPATHVCHLCSFAFCPVHAEKHVSRTRHSLVTYSKEEKQRGRHRTGDEEAGEHEDGAGAEGAAAVNQDVAMLGADEASAAPAGDVGAGAEAGQEDEAAGEAAKRDTVTVERLRCKEHGQEGSLYCKPDEKIICVVCAVQGDHKDHEIVTLHEAYVWQKSRHGQDLLACTRQMGEKIKIKWTDPEMSTEELEDYVTEQFDVLRDMVLLEEKRTLHLVDLKEAFLTATAAEKIAEITVETERLQEELVNITNQLCLLEKAEKGLVGPATALNAVSGPSRRRDIEGRARLPEPRGEPVNTKDFEDEDSGPSMDHAP